jgi:FMN phosphatase YigB (HAD superfamily)
MKNNTNLQNTLKERGIKALIFDLDNTVFDTDPYYIDKKEASFLEVVSNFPVENEDPTTTAKKISDDVRKKFYERGCQPLPVKVEYGNGLRDFYKEDYHPLMDEILDKHLEGFYENTPEIFPEAIELFSFFYHYPNMKFFAANTLAGEDWTKVKIEYMKEMCKIPDIPYYTTDIEYPKDWKKPISDALKQGVALEEILVVGDSLNSDILPSIEQGVEHLIWIDREERRDEAITSCPSVSKVMIVDTLSDIWDLE